jgi:hypothetical protein
MDGRCERTTVVYKLADATVRYRIRFRSEAA